MLLNESFIKINLKVFSDHHQGKAIKLKFHQIFTHSYQQFSPKDFLVGDYFKLKLKLFENQ